MGLACDHLVGVEMVIPSGKQGARVIRADERDNADLLWASRGGGGGNFGIATSYTFKFRPISTVTLYEATWGERDWQHLSELSAYGRSWRPPRPMDWARSSSRLLRQRAPSPLWHLHRIGGGTAAPAAPTAAGDR